MTIAAVFTGPATSSAATTPLADQTAADRAALARASEEYDAARAQAAEVDARVDAVFAELDRAQIEVSACQERLRVRAVAMYRADDPGALSLIFSAESIQDLVNRLDILERVARSDAENLRSLKAARAEAAKAAEELTAIQAEQARTLDALAQSVASAQQTLAKSGSALREYEAKVAAEAAAAKAAAAARAAAAAAANQQLTGSGEWRTGVASHYGINFTGRGASGETIGPYSMMVAHKTLPFGTLIEFEFQGKRAVAKVADRGPFTPGRDFDLGPGVVRVLGFSGVREVRYRIISQ